MAKDNREPQNLIIYTDGAYSRKHNEGAFAYVAMDWDGNIVRKRAEKRTDETNNRMEMKAILAALWDAPARSNIKIYSDSMYAIRTLPGVWRGTANTDLIDMYYKMVWDKKLRVTFHFVKGHSGDRWNEYADRMCAECLGYVPNLKYGEN